MAGAAIVTTPAKLAGAIRKRDLATRRALRRAVLRGTARGKRLLVRASPTDLGQLRSSWNIHRFPASKTGPISELHNDAPHAGIVEHGARPHPVSRAGREALYLWVYRNRHLFGFVTKSGRKKRVERKGWTSYGRGGGEIWETDPALARIVYFIVKRIGEKGQEPTYFVADRQDACRTFVVNEFNAELKKIANKKAPR